MFGGQGHHGRGLNTLVLGLMTGVLCVAVGFVFLAIDDILLSSAFPFIPGRNLLFDDGIETVCDRLRSDTFLTTDLAY